MKFMALTQQDKNKHQDHFLRELVRVVSFALILPYHCGVSPYCKHARKNLRIHDTTLTTV